MKSKLEKKHKAIELRLKGKTFSEIQSAIPGLPKSTLSGWLRNIKLTDKQKNRLEKNIKKKSYNARVKAAWTKKQQKNERVASLRAEARQSYLLFSKNRLFIMGVVLYWAEGNRKTETFQFSNSDPAAIKLILRWINKFCEIPQEKIKARLYIHGIYAHENCENFWSKVTNIPVNKFEKTVYKPTAHKVKKNPKYKGCLQIRIYNVKLFWRVIGWIDALKKDLKLE